MGVSFRAKLFHLLIRTQRLHSMPLDRVKQPPRSKRANQIPASIAQKMLCETRELNGYAVHTINAEPTFKKHIVYFHGGAYVFQASPLHWNFLQRLAWRAKAKVSFVQYPLAPESDHKEAITQVLGVTDLLTQTFDDEFYLAGDSAGAGLAVALLRNLIQAGKQQPYKKALLISPWLNPLSLDAVPAELQKQDLLLGPWLKTAIDMYAGDDSLEHKNISPINSDFSGFPPIGVWIGSRDIFCADMPRFLQRLEQSDISYHYENKEGMLHAYPIFPIPEAKEVVGQMVEFIAKGSAK